MTQRLPTVGGDNGNWGTVLNGFLGVSLDSGGNLTSAAATAAGAEMTTNKGAPSGYAPLNSSSLVPTTYLGTGTASSSNYLRGDGTWTATPTASNATTSTPGLIQLAGDLGGTSSSATAPTLANTANVQSIIGENNAANITGIVAVANGGTDSSDTGSGRANLHVPVHTPAAAVLTSNTSFVSSAPVLTAGTTAIDGYAIVSGDLVLLVGQTTTSQDGLWQVPASGSVGTRPTEFGSGTTVKGRTVAVMKGAQYPNTVWVFDAPTAGVVIDSGSQTWKMANAIATGLLANRPTATGSQAAYFATDDYGGAISIDTASSTWTLTSRRGLMGSATLTANSATFTNGSASVISGLSVTVTVGVRPIKVSIAGQITSSVANNVQVQIAEDSATVFVERGVSVVAANEAASVDMSAIRTATAGSHTYTVRGQGTSGTNSTYGQTFLPFTLMVEEV